jgi:hypothetical protein
MQSLVSTNDLVPPHSMHSSRALTHPHTQGDLGTSFGQALSDAPPVALVVSHSSNEDFLACRGTRRGGLLTVTFKRPTVPTCSHVLLPVHGQSPKGQELGEPLLKAACKRRATPPRKARIKQSLSKGSPVHPVGRPQLQKSPPTPLLVGNAKLHMLSGRMLVQHGGYTETRSTFPWTAAWSMNSQALSRPQTPLTP